MYTNMSFYDILSPFVGHHILVDNAKRYPSKLNCISNNNPIESMPPLEKYCYVTDRRMKIQSKRQQRQQHEQQTQTQKQHYEQKKHASLLSLSYHNDSIIISKNKKNWINTSNKTLLIPAKKFHDEYSTSKQKKHDKAPKAPIRWTTTTETANATMIVVSSTSRYQKYDKNVAKTRPLQMLLNILYILTLFYLTITYIVYLIKNKKSFIDS